MIIILFIMQMCGISGFFLYDVMCDVSTLTNECSVWSRLERVTILFDVMTMLMIIKQRKKGGVVKVN